MTTIGPATGFPPIQPFANVDRRETRAGFDEQLARANAPTSDASTAQAQSPRLESLLSDLKDLKSRQLEMSIKEYLSASFALKEQISTERLNAGEDLDTVGVRFNGQNYRLAVRPIDISVLTPIANFEGPQLAGIERFSHTASLTDYPARRPDSAGVKA